MRVAENNKLYLFIFTTQFMGIIIVEGFSHKPFLVERFKRFDDNDAEVHTSENIQHCLGLFFRFCKKVKSDIVYFKQ